MIANKTILALCAKNALKMQIIKDIDMYYNKVVQDVVTAAIQKLGKSRGFARSIKDLENTKRKKLIKHLEKILFPELN